MSPPPTQTRRDAVECGTSKCNPADANIRLSIFDLDRTLTRRPTYSLFLIRAALSCAPLRLLSVPVIIIAMLCFKLGLIERKQLKEIMHRLMIGARITRARIEPVARAFAAQLARSGMSGAAIQRMEVDRAEGRRIIIASASPSLYLDFLAPLLEIDLVISSRSLWEGDFLLHRIDGENCYGAEKLRRARDFLTGQEWNREETHIRFYSDDASDMPMFEWADEPVAVHPSRRLRPIARARNWPIID